MDGNESRRGYGGVRAVGSVLPANRARIAAAASVFFGIVPMIFASSPAHADLFSVTVTIDGTTRSRSFQDAQQAITAFETQDLKSLFPSYSDLSAATGTVNFRGLSFTLAYPIFDNPQLDFIVPSLNIDKQFHGATRDESSRELLDFLKSQGGAILNEFQRELARASPVDPIAGNPNSLQGSMIANAFGTSFDTHGSGSSSSNQGSGGSTNLLQIGASGGAFRSGGYSGSSYTLPLGWTSVDNDNQNYQLQLSLPITYSDIEGAKSFGIEFGVGFQFPVMDNWTLTPRVSYGAAGSVDQGSIGQMIGGSVTSNFTIKTDWAKIEIVNMGGYIETLPFSVANYSYNPGIENTMTKDGILLDVPLDFQLFGQGSSVQGSVAVTHLFGTKLFLNTYYDVAFSFGTEDDQTGSVIDQLRLGVTGTFGDGYKGFTLNVGYEF